MQLWLGKEADSLLNKLATCRPAACHHGIHACYVDSMLQACCARRAPRRASHGELSQRSCGKSDVCSFTGGASEALQDDPKVGSAIVTDSHKLCRLLAHEEQINSPSLLDCAQRSAGVKSVICFASVCRLSCSQLSRCLQQQQLLQTSLEPAASQQVGYQLLNAAQASLFQLSAGLDRRLVRHSGYLRGSAAPLRRQLADQRLWRSLQPDSAASSVQRN